MKNKGDFGDNNISLFSLLVKLFILFICVNFAYYAVFPVLHPGKITLYNHLFPGRLRLPFGEHPERSYNLSIYDLDAMFASHIVSAERPNNADEFRIFLIGDSSVWGTLLKPEETLTGHLNRLELKHCGSRRVVFYNLGYPTISLLKDLVMIEKSLQYQPDMILWLTTLEAFPKAKQLSPIVRNNRQIVNNLVTNFHLDIEGEGDVTGSLWERTIAGNRRGLADLIRLQIYGILWAATGIDQEYPGNYAQAQRDLDAEVKYHDWSPDNFNNDDLSWDVLRAGIQNIRQQKVQVVLVNEPILVSTGLNSDIRYNFFYPKWAYDEYRQDLDVFVKEYQVDYLDLWNLVPEQEFTNSAIHLTPTGSDLLARNISEYLRRITCK